MMRMFNGWNRALLLGVPAAAFSAAVAYAFYCKNYGRSDDSASRNADPSDEEKVNELVRQRFQACSKYMKNRIAKLPKPTQLELYAWYKQATKGSLNPNETKPPRSYDVVGKAKYDAWKKLQGTSKSSAMQLYIDKAMLVEFTASMQDDGSNHHHHDGDFDEMEDAVMDIGGMGNKPSTLNYDDEDEPKTAGDGTTTTSASSALHEAAVAGNLQQLEQLIGGRGGSGSDPETGEDGSPAETTPTAADVDEVDGAGQTALHLCADRGHLDCLDLLIRSGARADLGDRDGITPLQTAVVAGRAEICRRLLEAGADPDKPDCDGDTPRGSAQDDEEIRLLLEKYPAK